MKEPATLAFIGDVMLGRGVSAEIPHHSPAWVWGDQLPVDARRGCGGTPIWNATSLRTLRTAKIHNLKSQNW